MAAETAVPIADAHQERRDERGKRSLLAYVESNSMRGRRANPLFKPKKAFGARIKIPLQNFSRGTIIGGRGIPNVMNRDSSFHRWIAALLSVAMFAGILLPAVQRVCATPNFFGEAAVDVSPSFAAHHGTGSHDGPHGEASVSALDYDAEENPVRKAAPPSADCVDLCLDGCGCTVQSIPVDVPDLHQPERSAQDEDSLVLSTADHAAVPTLDRATRSTILGNAVPLFPVVRLHVWTATFLK